MADKKISALTSATTPLAGTEVLPIVQSGATVKVAVSDLTTGRAISATAVTATTGNFVVGTSGQGIDFSATPGTGTSELLADYEEGNWTPTGSGITLTGASGRYTKIGDTVHCFFEIIFPTTVDANSAQISGLPFSAGSSARNGAALGLAIDAGSDYTLVAVNSLIQIYTRAGSLTTNALNSTKQYYGTLTYKV
jgi:hypothetical protein